MLAKANLVSKQFGAGTTTFGADQDRTYLLVVVDVGTLATIEFGEGGGLVPLTDFIEPTVAPISQFQIVSDGNYTVLTVASSFNKVT